MINFKAIEIGDKTWITQKMNEDDRRGCEFSFANNLIWSTIYKVEVAEAAGCCIIKFDADGTDCYAFPIGAGDKVKAVEAILEHA